MLGDFNGWTQSEASELVRDAQGYWTGFVPGLHDDALYKFFVVGEGCRGWKRDPYSRELDRDFDINHESHDLVNGVVRDPHSFPWHDRDFRPPPFNDLILYQLHIGTFHAVDSQGLDTRPSRIAKYLDVLKRVEYLAKLGVNAIQLLPVVECPTQFSLGYNGTDYFSPEFTYTVPDAEFGPYLDEVNKRLTEKQQPPLVRLQLVGQSNQLKALIDVCHLFNIAVLIDVVYNHAGGDFGDQSLYFFDRARPGDNNNSLYFTDQGHAGGLIFAYWNKDVSQFLINNAKFFLEEYHVDGFRYDRADIIDHHGGGKICQDLTNTLRFLNPRVPHIAEYWEGIRSVAVTSPPAGALHNNDGLHKKTLACTKSQVYMLYLTSRVRYAKRLQDSKHLYTIK